MRAIPAFAACLLTAVPLLSFGPSARADSNDFMGQAQRFLNGNNGNNGNDNRDAYERGRDDELRRQQAGRDRDHDRRDDAYRRDNTYRGDERPRGPDSNDNYR
jgi:hypothetical protein